MGAAISDFLPLALQNAMGIALYGMFIALIVPASRESVSILIIVLIAVAVIARCSLFRHFPLFPPASGLFGYICRSRRWSPPVPEGREDYVTREAV